MKKYCGYRKADWNTLTKAYGRLNDQQMKLSVPSSGQRRLERNHHISANPKPPSAYVPGSGTDAP